MAMRNSFASTPARPAGPVTLDARTDRILASRDLFRTGALRGCFTPTVVVAALLAVAAVAGMFGDAYQSATPFARNAYRGADLVSLVLALPMLVLAAVAARRGSTRGLLLWLGAIAYIVYQYAYTFAFDWSRLFPVYLVLLSLSGFTLARALIALDLAQVVGRFSRRTPVRVVGAYLVGVGVCLGLMEAAQVVSALVTGEVPRIVAATGHPTSPVYILDLGLVVPLMLLAAVWLRARRPWGYVTAAILLVKGTTVGSGLLAANLFAALDGGATDGALNVLWAIIAGGSGVLLWRYLTHVQADPIPREDA
jgi:hypothetical protein